jgi:hypothetical protein
LKLRREWETLNYKLHLYWYLRGLLDELHSRKNLNNYLQYKPVNPEPIIEINLKNGLEAAEMQLDELRPCSVHFKFGDQMIGTVLPKPGWERLRGAHLRNVLASELSLPLLKSMALHELMAGETL